MGCRLPPSKKQEPLAETPAEYGYEGNGRKPDSASPREGGFASRQQGVGHRDTVTVWSADEILVAPLGQTVPSHQIPLKEHVPSHVQQTVFPDILQPLGEGEYGIVIVLVG